MNHYLSAKLSFMIILMVCLLTACSGDSDNESLNYLTISDHDDMGTTYGDQINYNELHKVIIKDADSWAQFWNQYTQGKNPAPQKPQVDFTQDMVVGIFMEVGNPCTSFKVKEVTEDSVITLHYESVNSNEICIQVTADKAEIISLDKSNKNIEFRKIEDKVTY